MSQKGSQFERDFCRQLSLWWSEDDEDDDLFWRTSQSGGRATTRAKKGKTTKHCGDICATHPDGQPLVRVVTFELKRGYNREVPHNLLDRPSKKRVRPPVYEEWIRQARRSAVQAGTPYWMIVHKRDSREPTILFPMKLWNAILDDYGVAISPEPRFQIQVRVDKILHRLIGMRLKHWWDYVEPRALARVLTTHDGGRP